MAAPEAGDVSGNATVQPRVQAPGTAAPGQIIQIKTLISHPMETGLRHDDGRNVIPRNIINSFTCRFDDDVIFSVELHEAMAANPFLEFSMRAVRSGRFTFVWQEDGGTLYTLETPLTVSS